MAHKLTQNPYARRKPRDPNPSPPAEDRKTTKPNESDKGVQQTRRIIIGSQPGQEGEECARFDHHAVLASFTHDAGHDAGHGPLPSENDNQPVQSAPQRDWGAFLGFNTVAPLILQPRDLTNTASARLAAQVHDKKSPEQGQEDQVAESMLQEDLPPFHIYCDSMAEAAALKGRFEKTPALQPSEGAMASYTIQKTDYGATLTVVANSSELLKAVADTMLVTAQKVANSDAQKSKPDIVGYIGHAGKGGSCRAA